MITNIKDPLLGVCVETHCKAKATKLNFCKRHYAEFKFGVIRKDGSHPTDHERKSDQYKNYKSRLKLAYWFSY